MPRNKFNKWQLPLRLLIAFIVLFTIVHFTGLCQWHTASTNANAPNIQIGSSFMASILSKPKRNDFVLFDSPFTQVGKQSQMLLHRLCALPGDTVLIKDGVVFVNGINMDKSLSLQHYYRISMVAYNYLQSHGNTLFMQQASEDDTGSVEDSIDMHLPDEVVKNNGFQARVLLSDPNYIDVVIQQQYGKPWNADYFGPLVVPANTYFFLGDNRSTAQDSRYLGCIPQKNCKQVVVLY
jgi:signal peptidase I